MLLRRKEKMKNANRLAMALLVVFAISIVTSIPLATLPTANAVDVLKTYAISDAIPNPVGVGQTVLLKAGVSEAAPSASYGWTGITITVTKPDGHVETLGPLTTDSTGSTYTTYVPDQVGDYTLTTNFPNNTVPITFTPSERGYPINAGTVLLASTANSTLHVVAEAITQTYPGHALPTEYWSRPIDPQLREWYSISGNWVARPDNSFVMYQDNAPETAHVLWATPEEMGGLSGGLYAGDEYIMAANYAGDAYEGRFANSVIINGILYYNTAPQGTYSQVGINGIQAINLHTGEKLWFLNGTLLSFGQTMFFPSYNVNGVFNYLWSVNGANYTAYSPNDGSWQFMFYNVPSSAGTINTFRTYGPNGEILIYVVDRTNGWMALWNSTLAGQQNDVIGTPSYGSWSFGVLGLTNTTNPATGQPNANPATTNQIGQQTNTGSQSLRQRYLDGSLSKCYSWNVTIPKGLPMSSSLGASTGRVIAGKELVGVFYNTSMVRIWALPLDKETATRTANPAEMTSAQQSITPLFDKTWTPPSEWLLGNNTIHFTGASSYVTDPVYGNGVVAVWSKELRTHYGFSLVDGSYLWATESENYLDQYGWGNAEHTWYFAYGKLYSVGIAGILYAYDLSTGKTAWTYNLTDPYAEPVTGENWWGWISHIAAGKVYIGTLEHSANNPIPRGGPYACVNATDGSEIFRVNGLLRLTRWGGNPVMGDGIIAGFDTYDLQIYALGKGPTKLTVTAPDVSVDYGKTVVLKGTVTDISPGTQAAARTLRFPNGVPAVSDESQSAWMMYVYKQFECPANATGVPLTFSVLDSNGNYRTIGTTTSDSNGAYSFAWKPDIAGKYTVYVTFAGSKAYYGSVAQSAFFVEDEVTTPAPTQTPPNAADLYLLPGIAAIIVVIIVVGAVIVLVLSRKHP